MREQAGPPDDTRRGAGELEAAVLAVLQAARRPLAPGEVREQLGDGLAYTTVVTILSRLHAKGVLDRHKAGRAFRYAPVADEPGLAARRMARLLDGEADREAVLARFVSGLSSTDEDLLRRMLGDEPGQPAGLIGGLPCTSSIYLPLVLPLLAAAAARPLAERLPPAAGSWLLAGSALALAAASSAVLGLLTLTALLRIPLVRRDRRMSVQVLSRDAPASLPVAVAAGALLAASVTAAGGRSAAARARSPTAFGQARLLPGAAQVVVTDDETADAYTLPGWPCRIVVTAGMMRALTAAERQVLLAHEQTHAAWFHYLFTSAARVAAAANPLLRPVAAAVGYTVERWADERAATSPGTGRWPPARSPGPPWRSPLVRRRDPAALVGGGPGRGQPRVRPGCRHGLGSWGFAPPDPGRSRAGSPRCSARRRNPHLLLLTLAVLLVAMSGLSALEASRDLHSLLELAQAAGRDGRRTPSAAVPDQTGATAVSAVSMSLKKRRCTRRFSLPTGIRCHTPVPGPSRVDRGSSVTTPRAVFMLLLPASSTTMRFGVTARIR